MNIPGGDSCNRWAARWIGATLLSLVAVAHANPAKGDRELGEYLASQCTTCHQLSGKSAGAIPPIIGWPDDQFVAVIQAYKSGARDNETMRTIAHRLKVDEIEALAAYFGSLAPAKP